MPLPVFYIYTLLEYIINKIFAIRKWTKTINQGATSLLLDGSWPSAFSFWQVCLLWMLAWTASLGQPLQQALCWWLLLLCPPYCVTSRFTMTQTEASNWIIKNWIMWPSLITYMLQHSFFFCPLILVLVTSEIQNLSCPFYMVSSQPCCSISSVRVY